MIGDLAAALDAWEHDTDVDLVLLDGAGDRGLCAGGDVRGPLRADPVGRSRGEQGSSSGPSTPSTLASPNTRSRSSCSPTASRWAAASGWRGMRRSASSPSGRSSRCPRRGSGSRPMSAERGCSPMHPGGSASISHSPARRWMPPTPYTSVSPTTSSRPRTSTACAMRSRPARTRRARPSSCSSSTRRPSPSALAAQRPWIDEAFAGRNRRRRSSTACARDLKSEASATADLLGELSPTGLAVTLAAVRRARELPDLRAALAQEYGLVHVVRHHPARSAGGHPRTARRQGPHAALAAGDDRRAAPDAAASALAYRPTTPLWG